MAAAGTPYRRTIRPLLGVGVATIAVVAAAGFVLSTRLRPYLRDRFIEVLREHYASDVALKSLNISLFPDIELAGTGLTLRHRGRTDVPPLIQIRKITIHVGFFGVLEETISARYGPARGSADQRPAAPSQWPAGATPPVRRQQNPRLPDWRSDRGRHGTHHSGQ